MNTQDYLSQVHRLNRRISNKLFEVFELKNLVGTVSNSVKEVNVQSGRTNDRTGDIIAKIVDMEHEIDTMTDEFIDKKNCIIKQLEELDFNSYEVLYQRYVKQKQWDEIATDLKYTQRHVRRLHSNALETFEKKFGKEYLDS